MFSVLALRKYLYGQRPHPANRDPSERLNEREEIRGVIDAWVLETGQEEHPQPPCSPSIEADGTPVGMPKDGTATLLAVEVAKGAKAGGKTGGKSKSGATKKAPTNRKRKG